MKKIIKLLISLLIIAFIIIIFVFSVDNLNINDENNNSDTSYKEEISINKLKLNINYINGNNIDDNLTYGNISTHEIIITNENKEKISFAVFFNNQNISNNLVTYDISYKIKESDSYDVISKNNKIKDNVLLYNITIDENQELFLKIDFKSNKESDTTNIKGILKIDNNVSETETFNQGIKRIQKNIEEKIESLNGISESAYYTLDIATFIDEDTANYKGVVFIDAMDISEPKFYYMVYNNKYMLNDYRYNSESIKKGDISEIDTKITTTFNEKNICQSHTKKKCLSFSDIKYNSKGDKATFISSVKEVLEMIKGKHSYTDKRVYIYDVKEDIESKSDIKGYVLIDNSNFKNEYYLYLSNELFMVSGYNVTKYGMFKENSTTIRAYNETSYKLSSESKTKVCKFTGFTECFNASNKKI